MTSLTPEQYLALSEAAYEELSAIDLGQARVDSLVSSLIATGGRLEKAAD